MTILSALIQTYVEWRRYRGQPANTSRRVPFAQD